MRNDWYGIEKESDAKRAKETPNQLAARLLQRKQVLYVEKIT
ncbi:12526_t:CDS:2 [Funneliformis mosseae]|uniref:12526_t:CDS:1 n=1 Tax=Funneliformis mosseae TaxID=27381 RepID=A0A9N9DVC2_FUNMO|nr:12526_t:CDS:2 [Funneliformis mosseae]